MSTNQAYKNEWARRHAWRNGVTPRPARPFQFQPLMDAAMARVSPTSNTYADIGTAYRLLGVTARLVSYWRECGVDAYSFDRCCCRLGLHPAEVLGRAWFDALEEAHA